MAVERAAQRANEREIHRPGYASQQVILGDQLVEGELIVELHAEAAAA